MNLAVLLASVLVLHPVVEEATPLRLVATGTSDTPVAWSVDGEAVAVTADGDAAHINVSAGEHIVRAETDHEGPWRILVRPAPQASGITYVDAWTIEHTPTPTASAERRIGVDPVPLALAAVGAALLVVPRRRPKRP